jgi:hypothetical protein
VTPDVEMAAMEIAAKDKARAIHEISKIKTIE